MEGIVRFSLEKIKEILALMWIAAVPLSTGVSTGILISLFFLEIVLPNPVARYKALLRQPLVQWMLVLVIIILGGTLYSEAPWSDIKHSIKDCLKFLLPIILIPVFQNEDNVEKAEKIFFATISVSLLFGYLKYYDVLVIGPERFSDAVAFKNHITTGLLFSFGAFLMLHKIADRRVPYGLGILFVGLISYHVIFLNIGRTGYVLLISLAQIFAWQRFKWRGIITASLILSALFYAAYLSSQPFQSRMVEHTPLDTSNTLRLSFIESSVSLFKEAPWIGGGTGSFSERYEEFADEHHITVTDNPHNQYLLIAVEYGITGLCIFGVALLQIFKTITALPKNHARMAEGILLALTIGCLLNSWVRDHTEGYFFFTMMALYFSAYRPRQDRTVIQVAQHA